MARAEAAAECLSGIRPCLPTCACVFQNLRVPGWAEGERKVRKWFRILLAAGLLVATGGMLPAAAQGAPHRAALGDRLAQRLESADPSESIGIRVRLKSSDLPGPGRSGRRETSRPASGKRRAARSTDRGGATTSIDAASTRSGAARRRRRP